MGMWCGPLFLQVFASQINTTSSYIIIPELGSESQGYQAAMALAATVVGGLPLACVPIA